MKRSLVALSLGLAVQTLTATAFATGGGTVGSAGGQTQDVNFYEKFNRHPTNKMGYAFNKGEVVSGVFRVISENSSDGGVSQNKVALRIDDGKIDSRAADTFHLIVTPQQYSKLRSTTGMRLQGHVRVTDIPQEAKSGGIMDDMFNYPAELVDLNFKPVATSLNPSDAQVKTLPAGTQVRVEGTVLTASKDLITVAAKNTSGTIAIHLYELEMPQIADVANADDEIYNGKPVIPGEVVRIMARIGKSDANELVLTTDWCNTIFLLGLDAKVQKQLDGKNQVVAQRLAQMQSAIASNNFAQARQVYSQLVQSSLNTAQRAQVANLRNTLPEQERPLATYAEDARFTADEMNKDFKKNIDAMTVAEYIQLMTSIASDKAPMPHEADYMFRLADDMKLSTTVTFSVSQLAVQTFTTKFENLVAKGETKLNWDEEYFASQALMSMGIAVTTKDQANTLAAVVNHLNAVSLKYPDFDHNEGLTASVFGMANFREVLAARVSELNASGNKDTAAILQTIKPNWYRY